MLKKEDIGDAIAMWIKRFDGNYRSRRYVGLSDPDGQYDQDALHSAESLLHRLDTVLLPCITRGPQQRQDALNQLRVELKENETMMADCTAERGCTSLFWTAITCCIWKPRYPYNSKDIDSIFASVAGHRTHPVNPSGKHSEHDPNGPVKTERVVGI